MLLKRLPLLIAVILLLSIIGSLYWQLTPFFQHFKNPEINKTAKNVSQQSQNKYKRQTSRNIASFKLFGNSQKSTEKTPIVTKKLPKTTLNLRLTGVLLSDIDSNAGALIQGPDNETINYKVGDELPGGALLKKVLNDRVVVERSGHLENLMFVESKRIGFSNYSNNIQTKPVISTGQFNYKNIASPSLAADNNSRGNPARTLGVKERLSKLRKRLLKNRH